MSKSVITYKTMVIEEWYKTRIIDLSRKQLSAPSELQIIACKFEISTSVQLFSGWNSEVK